MQNKMYEYVHVDVRVKAYVTVMVKVEAKAYVRPGR